MTDYASGWTRPSETSMASANRMIDLVSNDPTAKADNPIMLGLKLHMETFMSEAELADPSTRNGLAKAVARVIEADQDTSRAQVGTLHAARMIAHDTALQYEASLVSQAGVSRIQALLGEPYGLGRDSAISSLPGVRYAIAEEPSAGIDAMAEGDFHKMSPHMSNITMAAIDATRTASPMRLDAYLMETAGVIPADMSREIKDGNQRTTIDQIRALADGERLSARLDETAFGVGRDRARERVQETEIVASREDRRARRIPKSQYFDKPDDMWREDHLREAVRVSPELLDEARGIVADSRRPDPLTKEGKAVRSAVATLEKGGAKVDQEAHGFVAAVARSVRNSHSVYGAERERMVARIVADVQLQRESSRMLSIAMERADGRYSETKLGADIPDPNLKDMMRRTITTSPRDIAVLEAMSTGSYESIPIESRIQTRLNHALNAVSEDAATRSKQREQIAGTSKGPAHLRPIADRRDFGRSTQADRAEFGRGSIAKGPRPSIDQIVVSIADKDRSR